MSVAFHGETPQGSSHHSKEGTWRLFSLPFVIARRTYAKHCWRWVFVWASVIVGGAMFAALANGHGGWELLATLLVMGCLTVPYLAFAMTSWDRPIANYLRRDRRRLAEIIAIPLGLYFIYSVATNTVDASRGLVLLAFLLIPSAFVFAAQSASPGSGSAASPVTWQDFAAIFCIWIPFDAGWLKGVWAWPEGDGAYILNTLLAINLAVLLFGCYRGFHLKFRFKIDRSDLLLATSGLAAFIAVALPLGFVTEFISWTPNLTLTNIIGVPLGIFFFVAIPEELLFRGLLQQRLKERLGSYRLGLLIASVFFGLTHLNNGLTPDWRYAVLATVAGLFYGAIYERCRSILPAALTHAAVDTLWIWFFLDRV